MELPPQPKLTDFPGHEYGWNVHAWREAVAAWERVCAQLIQLEKDRRFK